MNWNKLLSLLCTKSHFDFCTKLTQTPRNTPLPPAHKASSASRWTISYLGHAVNKEQLFKALDQALLLHF